MSNEEYIVPEDVTEIVTNDVNEDELEIEMDAMELNENSELNCLVFNKHSDPEADDNTEKIVLCIASHPTKPVTATGGEDDSAYVWNSSTGDVQLQCSGHKDSVVQVEFNHDGTLLATGDMSGFIQVWNWSEAKVVWQNDITSSAEGGNDDLKWLCWHRNNNILLSGNQGGDVYMWLIPSGQMRLFAGFGVPCTAGCFCVDGKRAFVAYEDGSLRVWSLRDIKAIFTRNYVVRKHVEKEMPSVRAIATHDAGILIAAGYSNNVVRVLHSNSGNVIADLSWDNTTPGLDEGVECLLFCPSGTAGISGALLCYGTMDGRVLSWNLTNLRRPHFSLVLEHAVTFLVFHKYESLDAESSLSCQSVLFAACLDGCCRIIDIQQGSVLGVLPGHSGFMYGVALSFDADSLLTCGADGTARVFSGLHSLQFES